MEVSNHIYFQAESIYMEIIEDFPSMITKSMSHYYLKKENKLGDSTLTYGEIEFDSWKDVFSFVRPE